MTAAAAALVSTDLDFFKHDRDFHLSTPPLFFTFLIPTRYYFYTFLASFKKKLDFWSNSKVLHVKTFFCWRLIGKLFDAKISTAINWVSEQEREREEIKIKSIHQNMIHYCHDDDYEYVRKELVMDWKYYGGSQDERLIS